MFVIRFVFVKKHIHTQITNGEPNFSIVRRQVQVFLPEEMQGPLLNTIDFCAKTVKKDKKDKCETGYKWVYNYLIVLILFIKIIS